MQIPAASSSGDFWFAFLSIIYEGLPFILLGALISGIIDVWLPSSLMERLLPKNKGAAVIVGGLLGIIFPVCECAIVPVIRRLVQKGLPVGCAMSYMLAAPIVNPIVALSTMAAFQMDHPLLMTGMRVLTGFVIAVAAGMVMSRVPVTSLLRDRVLASLRSSGQAKSAPKARRMPFGEGIVRAFESAQRDFLDVALYFFIGVAIAAMTQTQVLYRPDLQAGINNLASNHWLAAPVLMVLAFVLSLCSTTDAFVIAQDTIFPASAKLAFLVFGPMLDMKLLFLYSSVLKPKAVLWLSIGLFIAVYAASFAAGTVFNPVPK
ncbi:MAG TPA: permease [Verrucomicrobiales bacterium]|nr:permease [Verrucomicrobiales bacterium]